MKTPRLKPAHARRTAAVQVPMLLLLVLLPFAGFLFVHVERKRRRTMHRVAGASDEQSGWIRERRIDFYCMATAAGMIVLALARPSFQEVLVEAESEGRDVVFLLDVSRSMLAGDLAPSRLESAKSAIRDCLDELEGDRAALVVFAGSASILCPLTRDHDFVRDKLGEAHPDVVAPGDVRVGGTRIGDAIHKTIDKLLSYERRGYQDLILLSDGGDQESAPTKAAQRLVHVGANFFVVGIGDSVRGARIPLPALEGGGFVVHDGEEVWTLLETGSLEALAKASRNGVFLNAGTKALPLGAIYRKASAHFRQSDPVQRERLVQRQETFPAFLAAALLLLAPPFARWTRRQPSAANLLVALLVVTSALATSPALAGAIEPVAQYNQAWEQLQAKNYPAAAASFLDAAESLETAGDRASALYNAALSSQHQARADEALDPQSALVYYRQAAELYRTALLMDPAPPGAAWNLELVLLRARKVALELEAQQQPNTQPPPAENPESEPTDSESEEMEEGEGDADSPSAQSPDGPNAIDLGAQNLPPPAVEPEELLESERENAETRRRNRAANYQPVERDW